MKRSPRRRSQHLLDRYLPNTPPPKSVKDPATGESKGGMVNEIAKQQVFVEKARVEIAASPAVVGAAA